MLPIIDLGFVQVPTFFLVISFLMGLSFYLSIYRAKRLNLDKNFTLDLSLVLMIFAILGARLGHVFFENWQYYAANPVKVFYFWEGGFVFYGGFILSFAAGLGFLYVSGEFAHLRVYMRLFVPILSVVYALGRIGCFLEGCCYGKTCNLPWAVQGRHPTQIYSSLWELGILIVLLTYESRNSERLQKQPERLFFIWLLLHSIGRACIEFMRDDFRGYAPLVSLSTWVSLILFFASCIYFYRKRVLTNPLFRS
ncbi:MAG: prolipoprotein diacylglyceryl transferase [Bdellovibrionaceae bacterium]|nr:prolipoprotein diacylglyceryl transferase [Pseudobdellovibrionaceae bacterium]